MSFMTLWKKKLTPLLLAAFAAGGVPQTPAIAMNPTPVSDEVPLTRDILRTGQKLLMTSLSRLPGIGMGGLVSVNIQIKSIADFGSSESRAVLDLNQRLKVIEDRQKDEANLELRNSLAAIKIQIEIAKKQSETQDAMLTLLREKFTFDAESVMRKPLYKFPDDNLVVIVADFSSGNPDEGREIADEIAIHLTDLVKEAGISCHILVGETKPGLTIRSEQMARDAGNSLPMNTEYLVIWGTMSPRTVGKYRPHITSCWKQGEKTGIGVGLDLPIEASDLPLSGEPQERAREAFRRLIGVTCAAVPNIFAAHEINRERTPDLKKYYAYLGDDSEEVRSMKSQIDPLTRWTEQREDWSKRQQSPRKSLKRIAEISVELPHPKTIYDEKDGSILSLVADQSGKPISFTDEKSGKYICYMDVTETSNDQFLLFLNDQDSVDGGHKDNRLVGGTTWIDLSTDFADIEKGAEAFQMKPKLKGYSRNPVIGVSWFAARDYCTWAGKELPTEKEWEAAASREVSPSFPWGEGEKASNSIVAAWKYTMPGGLNATDRSRNGHFDMRGNAREWCFDSISKNAECAVRGGGFDDTKPEDFDIRKGRKLAQVSHNRDVGFRGVIRFSVEK
jgi:hypothetical protein